MSRILGYNSKTTIMVQHYMNRLTMIQHITMHTT